MQYRKLGPVDVSVLGFGCMRLPHFDNDTAKINEEESTRLIHAAIDRGVNYIDTAWPYHMGQSEPFTGKVLSEGGLRDKVHLATKLPSWAIHTREDCDKYLNDQLERLRTDHIDFYLVHSLKKDWWEKLLTLGVLEFLDTAIKDGRIRYAGFSFHDEGDNFAPIVDAYPWTFCQIQYNYMDENFQAGTAGLKYAHEKGLGIVIMEPLRGGKLTQRIPDEISCLFEEPKVKRTPAELALRWVWNHPEVAILLSGMNEMEQVDENCRVAEDAVPGCLTDEESEMIKCIRDLYLDRTVVACTNCKYCLPCPEGVWIPYILGMYNDLHIYRDEKWAKMHYGFVVHPDVQADKCVECGQCEEACPQNLPIIQTLKDAHKAFTE